MSESEVIDEIVRQGRVRDFMEHMLNRERIRAIRMRRGEHLFFRLVLSIGGFERIRISFGFLRILQPGMKSSPQ